MANENIATLNQRKTWQEVMQMDTNGVTSNFYMFFAQGFGEIYREQLVFHRLRKSNPDLVQICLQSGTEYSERKKSREAHYETIFPAYQFMEQNVHLTDPHVVRDGKVDMDYLFR